MLQLPHKRYVESVLIHLLLVPNSMQDALRALEDFTLQVPKDYLRS